MLYIHFLIIKIVMIDLFYVIVIVETNKTLEFIRLI